MDVAAGLPVLASPHRRCLLPAEVRPVTGPATRVTPHDPVPPGSCGVSVCPTRDPRRGRPAARGASPLGAAGACRRAARRRPSRERVARPDPVPPLAARRSVTRSTGRCQPPRRRPPRSAPTAPSRRRRPRVPGRPRPTPRRSGRPTRQGTGHPGPATGAPATPRLRSAPNGSPEDDTLGRDPPEGRHRPPPEPGQALAVRLPVAVPSGRDRPRAPHGAPVPAGSAVRDLGIGSAGT